MTASIRLYQTPTNSLMEIHQCELNCVICLFQLTLFYGKLEGNTRNLQLQQFFVEVYSSLRISMGIMYQATKVANYKAMELNELESPPFFSSTG